MALPWPSWENSHSKNFCPANRDVDSTPWTEESQRKCLLWPTFSIINVPFLLYLDLTHCWVSYTTNVRVFILCIVLASFKKLIQARVYLQEERKGTSDKHNYPYPSKRLGLLCSLLG